MRRIVSCSLIFMILLTACEKADLRLFPKDAKRRSTASGERVYRENCLECHGPKGKSVASMYPDLSGSAYVNGDAGKVIMAVLHGSAYVEKQPEAKVSSQAQMLAYKDVFEDIEIARLVNYIRTNFGNRAYMITSKDVAKARELQW